MSAKPNILLPERQLFSSGNPQLQMHKVQAGDQFGYRVLHLKPGVHFQKIKVAFAIDQEFYGTGVGVPSRHTPAHFFIDDGGRRFFNDFLMAALHGALALTQINHVAVLVTKHLDFNVTRVLNEFLKVDFPIIERAQRFALRRFKTRLQIGGLANQAHPLAAAAGCRLDHYREANLRSHCFRFRNAQASCGARNHGHSRGLHGGTRARLGAH